MSPEPTEESNETACNIADQAAISDSNGAGKAREVPGEEPMMYGSRPEIIACIVLIALLAIIGAIIFEALK